MLIESQFKPTDIITLKLIGGDELVGKFISSSPSGYEMAKPLVVMMSQQGFGLAPFMLTASPDATLIIKTEAVICVTKTYDGVAREYIKQTTGLIV